MVLLMCAQKIFFSKKKNSKKRGQVRFSKSQKEKNPKKFIHKAELELLSLCCGNLAKEVTLYLALVPLGPDKLALTFPPYL